MFRPKTTSRQLFFVQENLLVISDDDDERTTTYAFERRIIIAYQPTAQRKSFICRPIHAIICNTQFIWSLIYLDLVGLVRESLVVADPQINTITHTSWISTPFRSDCLVRSTTRNMLCIVGQYQTTIRWGCGHIPKMCNFVVVVGCFCVPCHWAWRFSSQMCVCVYITHQLRRLKFNWWSWMFLYHHRSWWMTIKS